MQANRYFTPTTSRNFGLTGRPQIPDRRLPLPNGQPLNPASTNPSAERI